MEDAGAEEAGADGGGADTSDASEFDQPEKEEAEQLIKASEADLHLDESKAYTYKMGQWRKQVLAAGNDLRLWVVMQITHLARSPIDNFFSWLSSAKARRRTTHDHNTTSNPGKSVHLKTLELGQLMR